MRKLLNKVIGTQQRLHYARLVKTAPARTLIADVPYYSQWESPELVEPILTGKIDASDDPNWKASGATSKDEYALWSALACGMACTKMILDKELGKIVPIVKLGEQSSTYGAYTMPLDESKGMVYRPFTMFLKQMYNLDATPILPLDIYRIIHELSHNSYIIASVSPKIRHTGDIPPSKGGHLVLIVGYDLNKEELYFHNPSGFTKDTQKYAVISFNDFLKFFGGRGIVVRRFKHPDHN